MALPTYVNHSSNMTGTGVVTLLYPASTAVGDMLVCAISHRDEATSHPTPSGSTGTTPWVEIGQTVVQGASMLTTWYCWLTAAAPSGGTISDAGDRTSGRTFAIRHADGQPLVHGLMPSVDATSDLSGSATGFTTTVPDCFICILCGGDAPDASTIVEFSGFTNGALGSLTERYDNSVATGLGGSYALATGTLAVAGAIGATTYTHATNNVKSCLVFAVAPPAVGWTPQGSPMAALDEGGPKPYGAFERSYIVKMHPVIAVGGTTFNQALDGTVAAVATMSRQVNKIATGTVATVGTISRQVNKTMAGTVATVGTLVKQVNKTLTTAVVATVATMAAIKVILKALSATVATVATMSRQVNKTLTDDIAAVGTMTKLVTKTLTDSIATVATMNALKVILKAMTATVATVGTMRRTVTHVMAASVVTVGTMTRTVTKTLTAAVATVATMARDTIIAGATPIVRFFRGPSPGGGLKQGTPAATQFDDPTPGGGIAPGSPGATHFDDPSPGG